MNRQFFNKISKTAFLVSALLHGQAFAEDSTQEESEDQKITIYSKRGLISYVSATATKDDTTVLETPMSISVLTEQRIEDLGAETIQDALGYVAGVYNGPFGVDTRGDWSAIRGASPVQYLDGMKMLYGFYNNTRPNPYSLNRVEVLKGPASVLYGQGSTGGIVNLVSKKPQAESHGEFWGQVGNYDRTQLAMDYTGALNSDASTLFRVNGMYRDSGTQTDFVDDNTLYFAPSVTFHFNDMSQLTLLANFQENESGSSTQFFPHVGTVREAPFGQISASRFVSEPEFDRYDSEQQSLTALYEHEINATWDFRGAFRYMDSSADYRTMYAWPFDLQADNRSLLRSIYVSDHQATSLTTDLRFHASFDLGSSEHTFVIGYDVQDAETEQRSVFAWGQGGLIDVYQPVYGQVQIPDISQLLTGDPNSVELKQSGLYIQDQIKFENNWIVSIGLRSDSAKSETAATGFSDNEITARAGVMYSFENGISPYFNYAESFEPVFSAGSDGSPLKPLRGEQNEIGLKYQPDGTEHLITASVFDITEKNKVVPAPTASDPTAQAQIGEANIEGYEIEAQLEWDYADVYASYTKTDTEDEFGQALNSIPDQMFSAWITYRPETFWQGFKIGAGVRYVGETDFFTMIAGVPTAYNTVSYTLWDMMVGYEFGQFDFSLNVDNVSDETVVTTCLNRGDCFYGQLRTVTANIRYQFD